MFLYGIGHAMADYYFSLPQGAALPPPLNVRQAAHIEPDALTRLLGELRRTAGSTEYAESGGSCVNMLKTAAALGARTLFSGAAGSTLAGGRDSAALFMQRKLAQAGVEARLSLKTKPTGRCLIVNCAGAHAIAASPSAAAMLAATDFDTQAAAKADAVIIEGMQLANGAVFDAAHQTCLRSGATLVIAAATLYGASQLAPRVPQLNELSQVLIFTNRAEWECAALKPRLLGGSYLITVTDGANGARAVSYEHGSEQSRASFAPPPEPNQNAIEPTGAGDVFAGAFAVRWLEAGKKKDEQSLSALLAFAHGAARTVLYRPLCSVHRPLRT